MGEAAPFQSSDSFLAGGLATEPDSLFALDVLRQRLHEKIQEARGQVGGGDLGVPERRLLRWLSHSAGHRGPGQRFCEMGRREGPGPLLLPQWVLPAPGSSVL